MAGGFGMNTLEVRLGFGLPRESTEGAVYNAGRCACVKVCYDASSSMEVLWF